MRNSADDFSERQAGAIAPHHGHPTMVPAPTAGGFERRETQKAALQRQNVALQIEVAQLHLQVRDLQLALVIEKALGVVNLRMSHLPSLGLVETRAELRKTS